MAPKPSAKRSSRNDSPAPKAAASPVPVVKPAEPAKEKEFNERGMYAFFAFFVFVSCCVTISWQKRGLTVELGGSHVMVFRSFFETWKAEREFFVFDLCALFLSGLCLHHARKAKQLSLYLSIFFGGALIDLTIRKMPQLASFWQAQNWMELLDYSEPAYILFGMYFVFQYPSIQLARNLKLNWVGEAAAAALLGTLTYHPYDLVGAKYVWWMWHRDDPLMKPAEFGVPLASTFWTMAYTGALAATLRLVSSSARFEKWTDIQKAAVIAPLAALGLMNVPFLALWNPLTLIAKVSEQHVLHGFRLLCFTLVAWGVCRRKEKISMPSIPRKTLSLLLLVVPLVCISSLAIIVYTVNPANRERHGLFPAYGNCTITEPAYFGLLTRSKYNCDERKGRNAILWDFSCLKKKPKAGTEWYSVCLKGFPEGWKKNFGTHCGLGLAGVGIASMLQAK